MRLAVALLCTLPTLPLAGCTDEGLAPPVDNDAGIAAGDGALRSDGPVQSAGDLSGVVPPDGPTLVGDGPATAADLASAPDLAGVKETVACLPMACDVPLLACCTATYGLSGTCGAANAGCANNQVLKFLCDGDEDCKNGDICCYHPQGGSQCQANCQAIGTRQMCHDDTECGNLARCCSLGQNTPYKACMIGICPF